VLTQLGLKAVTVVANETTGTMRSVQATYKKMYKTMPVELMVKPVSIARDPVIGVKMSSLEVTNITGASTFMVTKMSWLR
jgi:hypothetical protein